MIITLFIDKAVRSYSKYIMSSSDHSEKIAKRSNIGDKIRNKFYNTPLLIEWPTIKVGSEQRVCIFSLSVSLKIGSRCGPMNVMGVDQNQHLECQNMSLGQQDTRCIKCCLLLTLSISNNL